MTFLTTMLFVLAAGVTFVTINIMTPVIYDLWYNNLRDENENSTLITAGDNVYGAWQVMGYVVPGILIVYGVAFANRKRVNESSFE